MARVVLWLFSVLTKLKQIVKAGLSGLVASVVDFVALIILVELAHLAVGMAAFIAAAVGAAIGFCLAKAWAFEDREPVDPRQIAAYAGVAVGSAVLVAALVHLLAVGANMAYPVAKAIASITAFGLWSYPAQARWVFVKGESYAV